MKFSRMAMAMATEGRPAQWRQILNCVTQTHAYAFLSAILVLISSCVQDTDCVKLQMISLYSNDGAIENYTYDVPDLTKVSRIVQTNQLESICSQVGVWAFFTSPKYADSSTSYGYHPATLQWSCNERRVSAYNTLYKSVRHLGNLDLDASGISLFSEPLFAADEIYFDGDALSLPAPFNMNSFGFTGADNWTIFSNPNFSGDAVCLCSENSAYMYNDNGRANAYNENSGSGTSGVTFEERLSFSVGALRKSCYGSQAWLLNGEFIRPQEILNSSVITGGGGRLDTTNTNVYLESLPALELQPASHNFEPPLFLSGKELNLPFTIKFENFTAQQDSVWRIYPRVDFRGNPICIRGTGSFNNTARIGSVRAGCNDTNELGFTTESVTGWTASTSRYEYDHETGGGGGGTTTEVEYDMTTLLYPPSYSDYENSIEHASQRPQGQGQGQSQNQFGQRGGGGGGGNRKENGRVTTTFSVTDLDTGSGPASRFSTGGAGTGSDVGGFRPSTTAREFDESLDGLPTTPRYRTTTTTTMTPNSNSNPSRIPAAASSNPTLPPESVNSFPSTAGTGATFTTVTVPQGGNRNRSRGSLGRNLNFLPSSFSSTSTRSPGPEELSNTRSSSSSATSADEAIKQFYNTSGSSSSVGAAGKTRQQEKEKISTADTNSIFFTAFIITLILLLLCIVLAICVFLYFRATRKGSGEVKPVPSSQLSQSSHSQMQET